MLLRRSAISVLITASLVALAGAAHAVVYDVSVKNRTFCCTNPTAPFFGAPRLMGGYHTVEATASETGAAPQPIRIGMGHGAHLYSRVQIPPAMLFTKSIRNTFSVSNGAGTLQKSGGNAVTFSFCPKNVGLPAPGACTKASKATPTFPTSFNGRIKVTPGKNKFGGTLQILAGPGGIGGLEEFFYFFVGPPLYETPAALRHGGFDFAPIGAATPGYHVDFPIPAMTGMFSTGFMSMTFPNAALWENGAGPFTTGMVTLQTTMPPGKLPVRSVMLTGYDHRTPDGLGNIQVVSGLLVNATNSLGPGRLPLGWKMRIHVIPEPAPGLGLAAGALALLWFGARGARER